MPKLNVLVAGSTGYIGVQLINLLVKHNKVKIKYLCGNTSVGKDISNYDKTLKNKKLPKIVKFHKKLFWQNKFPENQMLEKYDFCGEEINLQKRNFKSDGKVLKFPSGEAGSSNDERIFLSKDESKRILINKPNAIATDFIQSPERDFPALIIYIFSIASIDPYTTDLEKIDKVDIPFKNPTIGLSFSFPILENQQNLSPKEIKDLNNKSKISYDMNAIAQLQENLPKTTPEEYSDEF